MFLRRLRWHLNENKVFIELISSIILAGVAIFVAIQANHISNIQTQLLEKQTQIMETDIQPNFEFEIFNVVDPTTGNTFEKRLNLYNKGNAINLVNFKIVSMLKVDAYQLDGKSFDDSIFIADYFCNSMIKSKSSGLLRVNNGYLNYETLNEIDKTTKEKIYDKFEDAIVNYGFWHYAEVVYINVCDETIIEYWIFDEMSYRKLEYSEGRAIFDNFDADYTNGRYIMLEYEAGMNLFDIIVKEAK